MTETPSVNKPMLNHSLYKLSAALITSMLLCLIAYPLVWPWRSDILNDVNIYIGAERSFKTSPEGLMDLIIAPFYRIHSEKTVLPSESKPVYMAALNLWCSFNRKIDPSQEKPWNPKEFFNFTLFTFGLLAIMLITIGWRFSSFKWGILVPIIVLLSPWSFLYLYYPAYVQLSIVFFLLTLLPLLSCRGISCFGSGILAAFTLLSNSAMLVYILGLGLFIAARSLPRIQESGRAVLSFLKGFAAVFIFFEIIKSIGIVDPLLRSSHLDSPVRILMDYYNRSVNMNHFKIRGMSYTPKHPFMLFSILRYQSWTMLVLCLVLPFLFLGRMIRLGWRQGMAAPEIRRVMGVWLPAFTGIFLMDFCPGVVQHGRAYYVGYSLLVLGGVLFWEDLQKKYKPLRWAGAFLLLIYFLETANGLAEEHQAFHGLNDGLQREMQGNPSFAIFKSDPHDEPMRHIVEKNVADKIISVNTIGELDPRVKNLDQLKLLVGPEIETILYNGWGERFQPVGTGTFYATKGLRVKTGLPKRIPYYGLYPPLIFEDEFDAWRFLSKKEFNQDDYRSGQGAITLWPVTTEIISHDNDITELVEKIAASESEANFGPQLLLDGGAWDVHAWHSRHNPQYPLWIDTIFRQEVILEALGFQAQFGNGDNLRRAPHEIKLFAGNDSKDMGEVASLKLQFPANGFWCFAKLPKTGKGYRFYRILILCNHGNKDYVTLQELKFYGATVDS